MQLITTIGRSKKQVSRIFLGTASPPYSEGGEQNALLSAMFEAGITAIDTARKYGNAERCLGKWLSQNGVREEVPFIAPRR